MPRNRMIDMLMMRDGRNYYGSESGRRGRRSRRDRGMGYGEHYGVRNGEHYPMDGNYPHSQYADERGRRDYESMGQSDMAYDNIDMRRRRNARGQYMSDRTYENEDYGFHEERGFQPVEAMGYFTGYYGGGQDMARGGRRDYGYDYNYDMRGRYDYGYDFAGDYGEKLTKEEMEHWNKKMLKDVDEKYKHFFTKENISQKARAIGVQMEGFTEDELLTATIAMYTDFCDVLKPYVGENMDIYVKMGKAFLMDKDANVKGGEKLAVYFDEIASDED